MSAVIRTIAGRLDAVRKKMRMIVDAQSGQARQQVARKRSGESGPRSSTSHGSS